MHVRFGAVTSLHLTGCTHVFYELHPFRYTPRWGAFGYNALSKDHRSQCQM